MTAGDVLNSYFALRFRQISPFGCDMIQKFSNNASAMKKLAARDYEDLLQVGNPIVPKINCSRFIPLLNTGL